MVVAQVDGKNIVNWLYRDGNGLRLQPLNHHHLPIYVDHEQQVDVQGVVMGIIHAPDQAAKSPTVNRTSGKP